MDEDIVNIVKKGTTTVGLVCREGLVLAADKRATAGFFVADKRAQKLYEITPYLALTMAGSVSDSQLLVKLAKAEIALKKFRTERDPNIKECANLIAGMIYSNVRRMSLIPGISHFILGGVDKQGFHIYDLFADGSVTEVQDFISSGSGSVMAYGVLETLYVKELTVKDGVALAVKSINAALQRDAATGNGIDVITITKDGIARVLEKEIDYSVRI